MTFACCVNVYGECAHEQHLRRTVTLTLTHMITAYSVSGNVVRVCILICATIQKPCRKRVYLILTLTLTLITVCVKALTSVMQKLRKTALATGDMTVTSLTNVILFV